MTSHQARHQARPRAFTLVELMLVLAIISVLAALAVFGVRRYLATSKTAEAKMSVGAIATHVSIQYERDREPSELLCSTATPVPLGMNQVQGRKYQPSTAPGDDFMSGSPIAGWQCLGFSITTPIHFQYHYQVGGGYLSQGLTGAPVLAGPKSFEAAARGDLDGDGATSLFTRSGKVLNEQMVLSTQLFMDNEFE